MLYVLITFVVLLFLNIYCAKACQNLFYNSKKSTMIELCHIAAGNVADLEVLNEATISQAVTGLTDSDNTRIIVTDESNMAIYDTANIISVEEQHLLYPEIVKALEGNNIFHWTYQDGAMLSYAAVPVVSYGTLVGCI